MTYASYTSASPKLQDLTGKRFGRLVVLRRAVDWESKYSRKRARWMCLCDCGNEKQVIGDSLKSGHTRSCGCTQREIVSSHGNSYSLTYSSWKSIKQRCYNQNSPSAHNYLGRGIEMCERWRDSFETFLQDMGERPSLKHSIDRIDNNKGYTPENCRWATRSEQMRNTRLTATVDLFGETVNIIDACEKYKIDRNTVAKRIRNMDKSGLTIEECFLRPIDKKMVRKK